MAPKTKKKWTFMVYLAGDNNLASAGTADLGEMKKVGSTDQVNVVAQFDNGASHKTNRYVLSKGKNLAKDLAESLGSTDTGDPKVLQSFIEWGINNYPAEHYMVVVWNHGNGWDDEDVYRTAKRTMKVEIRRRQATVERGRKGPVAMDHLRTITGGRFNRALFNTSIQHAIRLRGIAYDDNARDFLDNIELKKVVCAVTKKLGRKLDVLGMDACMMSMAEVLYQLQDGVMNTVASEETEPGDGWPYDTVLSALAANPDITPDGLAATVVQKYLASYGARSGVTQAACDLGKISDIASAIDGLAKVLVANISDSSLTTAILQARTQVQSYDTADYIDLYDFCELLAAKTTVAAVQTACHEVITALHIPGFVLQSGYKGASMQHSHGVSIYFPQKTVSSLYATLDFTKDTAWEKFLNQYLAHISR
jgi:hypothetical protein